MDGPKTQEHYKPMLLQRLSINSVMSIHLSKYDLSTYLNYLQEINVSGSKKVSDQGMINLFGYAGPDQGAKYLVFSPLVPSKREKT